MIPESKGCEKHGWWDCLKHVTDLCAYNPFTKKCWAPFEKTVKENEATTKLKISLGGE